MRSYSLTHAAHLAQRALFGGAQPLEAVSTDRIVLHQAEEIISPPAIYLESELEKIQSFHPETTRETEERRIRGGVHRHAATVAYRLENVRLRDAGFYKGRWSMYFPRIDLKDNDKPAITSKAVCALSSSYCGVQYFGHWLRDDATTRLVAETFGEPLAIRAPDWPHRAFYASAFGQDWTPTDAADIETLFVIRDVGQNSHKIARYQELRRRIRRAVTPKYTGHGVYLARGDSGIHKRIIRNEPEVIDFLIRRGFHILDVTRDPIEEIAATMLDAKLFVSIEGSQQSHALYLLGAPAGYVAIQMPTMVNNIWNDFAAQISCRYGFVIGAARDDGVEVDIPALDKTIDMIADDIACPK